MDRHDVYVQSLLAQYRVHQTEKIVFTILFIISMLMIPVAWFINHVNHDLALGRMIAFVALVLGLSTAAHCGNTLQVLRRITGNLNNMMVAPHTTFEYERGYETDPLRFWVTLVAKIIGALLLIWCFIRWPQF